MDLANCKDTPHRLEDDTGSRIQNLIRQCEAKIKLEEELRDGELQKIKHETRRILAKTLENPRWDPELLRMKLMPQDSEYRWVKRRLWGKIDACRNDLYEELKKIEGGELANGLPDGLNTPEDSMILFGDGEVSPVGISLGGVENGFLRERPGNDCASNGLVDGPVPSAAPSLSQGRSLVEAGILPPEQPPSGKRPLQDDSTIEVAPVRKKARHGSDGAERGFSTATGNPPKELRKITFDEVYQNGEAEYKHAIVQFPSKGRRKKWYILKCETYEHKVHFAGEKGVLRGAASHLASSLHGLYKSHGNSIEHLGWEVVDCNERLAELNNRAMDRAVEEGYKPLNTVEDEASSKTKTMKKSTGQRDQFDERGKKFTPEGNKDNSNNNNSVTVRGKKSSSSIKRSDILPESPITRPEDGGIYYAFWPPDQVFYLVFVLGWDGSPNSGLPETGGGLNGFGLLDRNKTRIPPCYKIDWKVPRILGWVEGYRDGESQEATREFPIMFFDTPRNTGGWIEAGYLAHFDPENPIYRSTDSRFVIEPEQVELALKAYARCRGFSSYQQFRESSPRPRAVAADSSPPSSGISPKSRTRSGSGRDQRAVRRSLRRVNVNAEWEDEEDDGASDWAIENDAEEGEKDEDDDGDEKGAEDAEDANGSWRRGSPELGEMNQIVPAGPVYDADEETVPVGPVGDTDGNSSDPDAPTDRFNSRQRPSRRRVIRETPSLPDDRPAEHLDDDGDELVGEGTVGETDEGPGNHLMERENSAKPEVSTGPRARECDSDKQEALATSGARRASRPASPMTALPATQPARDASFMEVAAAISRAAIRPGAKSSLTLGSEQQPGTFPLARYSDGAGTWSKGPDNNKLALRVDELTRTARGALTDGTEFEINPRHILSQHRIRDRETGYVRLTLVLDEAGEKKECVLFFADEEEGKTSSRLAREFWTWGKEMRERDENGRGKDNS